MTHTHEQAQKNPDSSITKKKTSTSRILECRSIAEVLPYIDQDTWLLVDLDNTLFQSTQALGHVDWLLDEVDKRMKRGVSRMDAFRSMYPLWKKTQKMTEVMAVEQALVDTIKTAQEKGITVLSVTSREVFLAADTLRQLNSLNVDFLKTAPSKETVEFFHKERVLYWQGILFVDTANEKGDIFYKMMERLNVSPSKLILLDDKKNNLESFNQISLEKGIDFIGVYYTAVEYGPKIYVPELAQMQLRFFKEIMSNEEAQTLLSAHTHPLKNERPLPKHLYIIISQNQWRESLYHHSLAIPSTPSIPLIPEDYLKKTQQPDHTHTKEQVLLTLEADRLIGRLIFETSDNKNEAGCYHLYEGVIPLDAVVEVRFLGE